ncbi:lipopolysaccharide biosynthesis protein [Asticcacaulis sp. EMRT-3]|uniref:lipopolysaccharide biosynthesis protein n=1 Tax=Asticcacaulis sp. EMRT-3 TaxID=3040349 RepID=UPI0024AF1680|nr:lipopolysaccharide biosynthesis protein [Asticcacaulis sp. EMRT-3]MDI7774730.1 lipopolysaccharide biosynthesis protein [Asticcacaulis sp. EMRT-3]
MFSRGLWGYLPANILQGLIGFATLMVFTRVLTPEAYGIYALTFGVSSLAQTAFFTWIEASMARFYPAHARDDTEAPVLYGTLYRLFIGVALLFGAVCITGLVLWPAHTPSAHALKTAIALGLGSVVARSLAKLVQEQRKSEGRVAMAAMIDMSQTVGAFVIGVGCALAGVGGASPVLGGGLIALFLLPFIVREDWGRAIRGRFERAQAVQFAYYGFPVSASLILTLALYTADRFLIAHFLNDAEAGAYHAGFSLASRILDVLFIWFGAAGAPAMVHALENGGEAALKATARHQLRTIAFVLFPAVGGLVMVAPSLGGLLIGEGLRDQALGVTPLIALGALFSGLNTYYFLQAFTLARKTRLLVAAMSVPAISNIGLNLALIPVMGLQGAALASAISFGLGLAASWGLGLNTLRLPVPLTDLAKTAACVLVMMAVLAVMPRWGGIAELAAKSLTGMAIYGALAWLLDLNDMRAPTLAIINRLRAKVFARATS